MLRSAGRVRAGARASRSGLWLVLMSREEEPARPTLATAMRAERTGRRKAGQSGRGSLEGTGLSTAGWSTAGS